MSMTEENKAIFERRLEVHLSDINQAIKRTSLGSEGNAQLLQAKSTALLAQIVLHKD